MCAIRSNELTICKTQDDKAVFARVPLSELQVTLWPHRQELFGLASGCCNVDDDIVCCVDSEDIWNEWLAVFQRLGIDVATKLGADDEEYVDSWLAGVEINGDALKARLAHKLRRLEEQQAAMAAVRSDAMTSIPAPATRSHAKQHFARPASEAANQLAGSTPLSSSSKTSNRSASSSEPERMQSPKMPPVLAWYFLYSHSTPERWRRRVSASDDIRAPAPARRPSAPYASSGSRFYAWVIKRMEKERMQQSGGWGWSTG